MLDRLVRALALGYVAVLVAGCADPEWARQVWPSDDPRAPVQPTATSEPVGLELSATAITWEPSALVVVLAIVNEGELGLTLDPGLVFLEYDGLEYAPESIGAGTTARSISPNESTEVELRYDLGRALTGIGARLRIRGMTRDGAELVEVPEMPIPSMPAAARPQ